MKTLNIKTKATLRVLSCLMILGMTTAADAMAQTDIRPASPRAAASSGASSPRASILAPLSEIYTAIGSPVSSLVPVQTGPQQRFEQQINERFPLASEKYHYDPSTFAVPIYGAFTGPIGDPIRTVRFSGRQMKEIIEDGHCLSDNNQPISVFSRTYRTIISGQRDDDRNPFNEFPFNDFMLKFKEEDGSLYFSQVASERKVYFPAREEHSREHKSARIVDDENNIIAHFFSKDDYTFVRGLSDHMSVNGLMWWFFKEDTIEGCYVKSVTDNRSFKVLSFVGGPQLLLPSASMDAIIARLEELEKKLLDQETIKLKYLLDLIVQEIKNPTGTSNFNTIRDERVNSGSVIEKFIRFIPY